MQPNAARSTRIIVFTGVLSALAIVLYFLEFPAFTQYLKVDLSDLPAAVAGILFGPPAAVAVELIKNAAHLPVSTSMGFGELMNFIVGVALTAPLAATVRAMRRKGRKQATSTLAAGAAGLCAMVLAGVAGNYLIAPPYFEAVLHVTLQGGVLWAAIGSATLLNLIKSVIVTLLLLPVMTAGRRLFDRYGS